MTIEALSQSRLFVSATSVGSLAYFAGGVDAGGIDTDRVDIYDASTGTWTIAALSVPRSAVIAVSVGTKALFAGGSSSTVIDIHDASTGLWSTANLPEARNFMAAASAGTKAYFAGGVGVNGASDRVDIYDVETGTWSVTYLAAARFRATGTSIDGLVMFAGGRAFENGTQNFDLVDLIPTEPVLVPFCFGDGTSNPCPCGNAGGAGEGCANTSGAGATLAADGWVSVSTDDLAFTATNVTAGELALLFTGRASSSTAGTPLGGGLRCTSGGLVRLEAVTADALGRATFGPGLAALGQWSAGDVQAFQAWYRDPAGAPCTGGTNLTSGIEARFFP